jgi:lysozyme family protein
MDSAWKKGIDFVLSYEGGLVDNPADPGGLTNFGISSRSYPSVDIRNLTRDGAAEIYKRDYWDAVHGDELPGPLAIAVFDSAVNQGAGTARRLLQISLGVDADGIIGPRTVKAAHEGGFDAVVRFLAKRAVRYHETMRDVPGLNVFAHNWYFRLFSLARLVLG